jgi:hypothetical protein
MPQYANYVRTPPPISGMLRASYFEFRTECSVLVLPWGADQGQLVAASTSNRQLTPDFELNSKIQTSV